MELFNRRERPARTEKETIVSVGRCGRAAPKRRAIRSAQRPGANELRHIRSLSFPKRLTALEHRGPEIRCRGSKRLFNSSARIGLAK